MKTSHILLATVALVTLTGMVATNVLLKQQYEKIDWRNSYQDFDRRVVPTATYVVIEGAPTAEIIVERSTDTAQALLLPSMANSFSTRQRGDTLLVTFTMNYDDEPRNPRNDIDNELPAGLVLRLPDLQSLRVTNSRLTLRGFTPKQLTVSLQNTRLRTNGLNVTGSFSLTADQNSFAVLGPDQYQSLRLVVRDSSGAQLNDTQTVQFLPDVSPKAEVQLRGDRKSTRLNSSHSTLSRMPSSA